MHLWLVFVALFASLLPANAALNRWDAPDFCKCICFGSNYTILRMDMPDNPAKPCLSCTKQWCLNQNLKICAGATLGDINPDTATGKEGDVEARCFQRDSPRDQLVVTIFLLTVFGLLLGAGIKGRMAQAGLENSINWGSGRRMWENFQPRRHLEEFSLTRGIGRGRYSRQTEGELRDGSYVSFFNAPQSP